MAWISARLDRLRQIVAECVKRGLTPQIIGWADFVNRKSADFGVTPLTARRYAMTLAQAWNHNKWRSYILNNDYLTKAEQENWLNKISHKS